MSADDLPGGERTAAVRRGAPRRTASPPTHGGRGEHDRFRPVADQERARARAGAGLARGRASGGRGAWIGHIPPPAERERLAGSLGSMLRALRAERGLSIRRLAERSAVAASTITRLERGERRPRPSLLAAIGFALAPDRSDELTARLIAAAGPSLRPDTEGSVRRRARRMERARRAARREAWRMERAAADARSEGIRTLARVLRRAPLHLAFEPDLTPGELERAERLLAALAVAQQRAERLLAAAGELTAALARPRHPLEAPGGGRARRILDALDAERRGRLDDVQAPTRHGGDGDDA